MPQEHWTQLLAQSRGLKASSFCPLSCGNLGARSSFTRWVRTGVIPSMKKYKALLDNEPFLKRFMHWVISKQSLKKSQASTPWHIKQSLKWRRQCLRKICLTWHWEIKKGYTVVFPPEYSCTKNEQSKKLKGNGVNRNSGYVRGMELGMIFFLLVSVF